MTETIKQVEKTEGVGNKAINKLTWQWKARAYRGLEKAIEKTDRLVVRLFPVK